MDNSSGSLFRRRQPSPQLVRSRNRSISPAAAISTRENSSRRFSSSERFTSGPQRSKSTSRSRIHNNGENINPTSLNANSSILRKSLESRDGFVNTGASKKAKSGMKSPSAWALSPGRSLGFLGSELPGKVKGDSGGAGAGGEGGGRVSKVLNYFKQRKVSPVQEEEYHRFRILHNRLLQWRFVNARAETSMVNVKKAAEITLFSVWVEILMLRKMIIEKRMEIQKLKSRIKLYEIINPELSLLEEWTKVERRNQESVSRLTRKLSALSNTLPLTDDLKADVESIYQALTTASEVMAGIVQLITKYQAQVERILYQVTELTTTSRQEEEYLQQILTIIPIFPTLLENEISMKVHLIQTSMESNNSYNPCVADHCMDSRPNSTMIIWDQKLC